MRFSFLFFYFFIVSIIVFIRFIHRVRILHHNKTNKVDTQFQENTWFNNYMLGLLRFRKNKHKTFMEYVDGFKERQIKWEETTPWYWHITYEVLLKSIPSLLLNKYFIHFNPPLHLIFKIIYCPIKL